MDQRSKRKKNILVLIGVLFITLIIIDRYYWAQISQWREDQATNIWLGYTTGITHIPVGLISSSNDIPNPNGMIVLGFFLSALPDLLSVSVFLGLAQIALLSLIGWKFFRSNWHYFLLVTVPSLSSVILRSTSVEFWNQYTITIINIFFIFWALQYLEKPSLWNLPPIVALIFLAPSLYLAGLVNAIVMTLITLGLLAYKRPSKTGLWPVVIGIALIILFSVFITWLPYFQNVSLQKITSYQKDALGPIAFLKSIWTSFFGIPVYGIFQWADPSVFSLAFKHTDGRILTSWAKTLLGWVGWSYLLQAVFAVIAISYAVLRTRVRRSFNTISDSSLNIPALRLVTLSVLFVSLSSALSRVLGGPDWINGERPDQTVQFLPLFLFFIFGLPILIRIDGRAGEVITTVSYFFLSIFTVVNLLCGFVIIRDHLDYRGKILSEADVPLANKIQVVDFIAKDWKSHSSSNVIPVDYDLGGKKWDWLPEFGLQLTKWYPAPMSMGRGFDYELLRCYGLRNQQEGIQLRTFGSGRYLVTYAFQAPPQIDNRKITKYIFGRVRVSVVEQ